MLLSVAALAQTTVLECTFETVAERSLWSFQNNSAGSTGWLIGTATSNDGTHSLYVSYNGGTTCSYQASKATSAVAYCQVALAAGTYAYSYDCNVGGECPNFDYMAVYIVPATEPMPQTTSPWQPASGALRLHDDNTLCNTGGWTTLSGTFQIASEGNYSLVFYWRNNADTGTPISAAVDNISLARTSSEPPQPTDFIVVVQPNNPSRGSVVGGGRYDIGNEARLIAAPHYGYNFAGWDDGETANPRYLTVVADTTLTALFFASNVSQVVDTVVDTIHRDYYHHDTITLRDTVVDTLPLHVYHIDTVILHDTLRTTVYHTDTVTVVNEVHDTLRTDYYHTDTAYLHDTLYIDYYHTDTIVLPDTHYLPVYITDTIWPDSVVHDTLRFTRYDTIYVDRIVIDTIIFTRYDTIISVETVYDTLRFTDTVTRFVVDTLILHDTIYLTDSASLGLDQTSESRFALRAVGNILVVDNPDCQPLWVYDTAGRLVVASRGRSHVELQLPAAGVYIVRVGDNIKRITTIR